MPELRSEVPLKKMFEEEHNKLEDAILPLSRALLIGTYQ